VASLVTIGRSTDLRGLLAVEMTGLSSSARNASIPGVVVLGNMHGNELAGRELVLRLAAFLCRGYLDRNETVVRLLESTRIFLLPSANPDGFQHAVPGDCFLRQGEATSVDVDLLSDFGASPRTSESRAIQAWHTQQHFALAANLMAGGLFISYPFARAPAVNPEFAREVSRVWLRGHRWV
jgi:carboxypeptidase D